MCSDQAGGALLRMAAPRREGRLSPPRVPSVQHHFVLGAVFEYGVDTRNAVEANDVLDLGDW